MPPSPALARRRPAWPWFAPARLAVATLLAVAALAGCAPKTVTTTPPAQQAAPPPPAPAQPAPVATPEVPPPAPPAPAGPVKVGLLLPLTGANAALGQAMLQAAEMALFEAGGAEIQLVVRDSEETGGAGAASQELVGAGVKLILGPVFAQNVAQAAPAARTAQVPMISFSTDRTVAGNGVYVMGILPQIQVDRVVRFAASRGARRVAALVPDTPFGRAVTGQLQQTVLADGGALAAIEYYPPGTGDFSPFAQRLGNLKDSFDAVLIPEGGDTAKQAVPLLAYYGVNPSSTRLLGTALWNDPALTREPALAGAWFAAPANDSWDSFAQRYRGNYGTLPPRIASLAYDATLLAVVLARSPHNGEYSAQTLTAPEGFSGIDGIFRFDPDGGVERGLAVYEIQSGGITLIDPAPQSFAPPGM